MINLVPTRAEVETRNRMLLTIAAYAYEMCGEIIMADADFDAGCRAVDLSINTNRPHLDAWWRSEFDPSTGMWIRRHPELPRVSALYERYRGRMYVFQPAGTFLLVQGEKS